MEVVSATGQQKIQAYLPADGASAMSGRIIQVEWKGTAKLVATASRHCKAYSFRIHRWLDPGIKPCEGEYQEGTSALAEDVIVDFEQRNGSWNYHTYWLRGGEWVDASFMFDDSWPVICTAEGVGMAPES